MHEHDMFSRSLSMRAKSCSGKDGHHSIVILPVNTETTALSCHCEAMALVTLHKSHHIVLFHHFCQTVKKTVSHSEM